jgi:putative hydrolase of the HAD superfamily
MRRPRAICFDMGYTLLRHTPTGPELYRQTLASLGYSLELSAIERAHAPARDLYVRATREGRDFESSMELAREFWTEYNTLVLDGLGLERERIAEVGEILYTTAWSPDAWQPFPDAIPTLDALRAMGIRMAVVSNFVDTQPTLCSRHGLSDYFDVVIASVDAGAMKPDPRIWEIALRRLGVPAADSWHVGDNYWADVLGARAAGLEPVWLDRDGALPHPDCARVEDLAALLKLVRGVEGEEAAA